MARLLPRRSRIGVVELHGVIGTTVHPGAYFQLLDRLERAPRVGCVVLDIDSPGGSVAASEALYLKVARLRQKKPVVAFIRGTGASGSYMVACAATRVIATPSAIVGSIGVISLRPVVAQLMERLGISVSVSKSGPLKDMGAFYRPPTQEEEQKLQSLINELFGTFVQRVAEARHVEMDQARRSATGEVYAAGRARELGLVDELGDFDAALDMAASLGRVPRRVAYLRPPRSMRERLLERLGTWAMEGLWEDTGLPTTHGLWYL
ncbi:MAG: signal peptide peptidase SppA [Chloroflexi bacterium]|nr:signal peptide peptidase SppA [Chloroflexota bacterium]